MKAGLQAHGCILSSRAMVPFVLQHAHASAEADAQSQSRRIQACMEVQHAHGDGRSDVLNSMRLGYSVHPALRLIE